MCVVFREKVGKMMKCIEAGRINTCSLNQL